MKLENVVNPPRMPTKTNVRVVVDLDKRCEAIAAA
jgi:hypothetical protein